jgi:hypothetical protein
MSSAVRGSQDVLDTYWEPDPAAVGSQIVLLTLTDRRSVLSGTVVGSDGRPVGESYFIVVFPEAEDLRRHDSRRVRFSRLGTDSSYTIEGLPSGDYRIGALADFAPEQLRDRTFFEMVEQFSVPIRIGDGATVRQDFRIAHR